VFVVGMEESGLVGVGKGEAGRRRGSEVGIAGTPVQIVPPAVASSGVVGDSTSETRTDRLFADCVRGDHRSLLGRVSPVAGIRDRYIAGLLRFITPAPRTLE
jgi:hypothetical protein